MTRRVVLAAFVALGLAAIRPAAAHPGHTHKVMGTVTARHENHLEVKAVDGKTVTITLNASTKVVRGKTKATIDDIKPDERVVVSAKEEKQKDGKTILVAHEIRLSERNTAGQ